MRVFIALLVVAIGAGLIAYIIKKDNGNKGTTDVVDVVENTTTEDSVTDQDNQSKIERYLEQIAESSARTAYWVKFWSVATIAGFIILIFISIIKSL